jgi:hypothetical protein
MRDHEHAGFSWYVSTKPDVFNPYNLSDRISRKTWYENVTYPDLMRGKIETKKIPKVKYHTHVHREANGLFTSLNCAECINRIK